MAVFNHDNNSDHSVVSNMLPAVTNTPHARTNPSRTLPAQKNVGEVVLSDMRIEAWYPSFYPQDLVGKSLDRLYVCKWCFKYTPELLPFIHHSSVCPLQHAGPLGLKIYAKDNISIYQVDGDDHKTFAQNLSLFAKLFLDTKSVFYDVSTFLYYLLYLTDPSNPANPPRLVGFFSKEKLSWDSNNLACIFVFPPWQKQRLGQVLMAVSYHMSKLDGRMGGPEKPLSELGSKAYLNYWAATISRYITTLPAKKPVTVKSISNHTYILPEDIVATLKHMNLLARKLPKNKDSYINKAAVTSWMHVNRVALLPPVDDSAFLNLHDPDTPGSSQVG